MSLTVNIKTRMSKDQLTVAKHFIDNVCASTKTDLVAKKILSQAVAMHSEDSDSEISISFEDFTRCHIFVSYWGERVPETVEFRKQIDMLNFLKKVNILAGKGLGVSKKWLDDTMY